MSINFLIRVKNNYRLYLCEGEILFNYIFEVKNKFIFMPRYTDPQSNWLTSSIYDPVVSHLEK